MAIALTQLLKWTAIDILENGWEKVEEAIHSKDKMSQIAIK